jgi:hypothetical protein
MAGVKDSTDGTTSERGKAARAMAGVGGVRSSDDPVPDLWFGQPAEERRDATCSAGEKRREVCGDGPRGLTAPEKVRQLQITLYQKASQLAFCKWNSESRMRENRLSGLMRGGKQAVIGHFGPLNPSLPAHSTQKKSSANCSQKSVSLTRFVTAGPEAGLAAGAAFS